MKIKSLTEVFLFVAVAFLASCSSSSDGPSDGDGGGNNGPTSITVNASSFFIDFGNSVTFNVTTNQGDNVTPDATIRVNGTPISGNTYTASATGTYTVDASYNSLTSSSITVQVLAVVESIAINVNNTSINLGDRIDFTVLATDTQGNEVDVTEVANVFINDSENETGGSYIPGEEGTYNGYASYDGFTTETLSVTVADAQITPATFNRRSLVEDYTGDWCGYCTRVAVAIEMVNEASDDVVIVATHVFNNDPFENQFGVQMANNAGVTGLPTAIINRQEDWEFPETNNIDQVTSLAEGTLGTGIAINSAVKSNNLSFMVSVGFGETVNGAKLVVYLLENGLVADQTNYYPQYYGGQDPVQGFIHDHVLRHSFTNVLGDIIPSSETVANNTYRMKMDYTIPAGTVANTNNLEIVAMLVGTNNQIINVNMASANSFAQFD